MQIQGVISSMNLLIHDFNLTDKDIIVRILNRKQLIQVTGASRNGAWEGPNSGVIKTGHTIYGGKVGALLVQNLMEWT